MIDGIRPTGLIKMMKIEDIPNFVNDALKMCAEMKKDQADFAQSIGTTVDELRALPEDARPAINVKWKEWIAKRDETCLMETVKSA